MDSYHQRIYDLARQAAAQIEADLQRGRISSNDLFDRSYQPIANTFPAKFKTCFDSYADQILPAIQEPLRQPPKTAVAANLYARYRRADARPLGADYGHRPTLGRYSLGLQARPVMVRTMPGRDRHHHAF